jgi:hypothetical protein
MPQSHDLTVRSLRAGLCAAGLVLLVGIGAAQPPPGGGNPFGERARTALAEPFVGLTADGRPEPGLFKVAPTSVSTGAVRAAAATLIAAMTDAQRTQLLFPVEDSEWRNWANVHRFARQGVAVADMTAEQREAAFALVRAGLSAKGYATARDIMRLNHHLAELVSNFDEYGEHLYYFTIMGTPSATEPWGWQLDGHHLVVNYFVLGDQVVMTPTFMGSEPVRAQSGQYAGTVVMQEQQDAALAFMQSLTDEQRKDAVLDPVKGRGNVAEMLSDNVTVAYSGLPATALDRAQRERLLEVVATYVGNMDDGHAAVKMQEIRAHLDRTYFAWKGAVGADAVFYYRIMSPVIYIEFDHQGPVALDGPRGVATRRHIHSVVRTPNGNDYGKDLLRQHYAAYAADAGHGHAAAAP